MSSKILDIFRNFKKLCALKFENITNMQYIKSGIFHTISHEGAKIGKNRQK